MALSLDYMGKFVIVMVTIAIGVSLIITFSNQIRDTSPELPGEEEEGTSIVRISSQDKAVELLNFCHDRSLEQGGRSFTCFLVVNSGDGNLLLNREELENSVNFDSDNLEVVTTSVDGESLVLSSGESAVVRYAVEGNRIVLEPGAGDE